MNSKTRDTVLGTALVIGGCLMVAAGIDHAGWLIFIGVVVAA